MTLIVVLALVAYVPKLNSVLAQGNPPSADSPQQGDRDNCGKFFQVPLHGFTPNVVLNVSMNYSEKICDSPDGARRSDTWSDHTNQTDGNGNLTWGGGYGLEGTYTATLSGPSGEVLQVTIVTGSSGELVGFDQKSLGANVQGPVQPTAVSPQLPDPTTVAPSISPLVISMSGYCGSTGQTAVNGIQRADGWGCIDGSGNITAIPLNAACGWQYSGYVAYVGNWSDWYSIGCVPNGYGNVSDNVGGGSVPVNPTAVPGEPTLPTAIATDDKPVPVIAGFYLEGYRQVEILEDWTNIRSNGDRTSPRIAQAMAGTRFPLLSVGQTGWYYIQLSSDSVGWVSNLPNLTKVIEIEGVVPTQEPATEVPAPVIVATDRPPFADAQSGNGIHWGIYCSENGYPPESHNQSDPYSLDCGNMHLSHDQVCLEVWGPDRQYAHHRVNELGSMSCEPSPQGELAPPHPEARTADGGIDARLTCLNWGWKGYDNSASGTDVAFTHRCITDEKVMYLGKPEFDQGCRDAWGRTYFAELKEPDSLGGWKCVQNPNAIVATPNGIDPRATTPIPPTLEPVVNPPVVVLPPTGGGYMCPPSLAGRLTNGGKGRVVDTQLGLYVNPTIDSSLVAVLPFGTTFTVVSEPNCQNGVNWYIVDYSGTIGWIPEGFGGRYYAEPYTVPVQPPVQPPSQTVQVSYYYEPFNTTYVFQVNASDKSNCILLNGSTIVAQEISRSSNWINGLLNSGNFIFDALGNPAVVGKALAAYLKNNGMIDTFRVKLDEFLNQSLGCTHSYYMLGGNATMDLYGLGNVVYGYFAEAFWVRNWTTHRIADLFQFSEDRVWDYPDDSSQINLGRAISATTQYPTASVVEAQIHPGFVSSK